MAAAVSLIVAIARLFESVAFLLGAVFLLMLAGPLRSAIPLIAAHHGKAPASAAAALGRSWWRRLRRRHDGA